MIITDSHVFFYRDILSQWTRRDFMFLGLWMNCCEQAMMAYKAMVFNDSEIFDQIMKADHPRTQQQLGRKVRKFDPEVWDRIKLRVVTNVNYRRFITHENDRELLLSTGDRIIVEASPTDQVWGVGLGENNPLIHDPANWRGQNLLGRALMDVREMLRIGENANEPEATS